MPPGMARDYSCDVATYLGLALDKAADRNSTLCAWEPIKNRIRGTFQRHALPMSWDFAEANSFGDVGGDFGVSLRSLLEVVDRLRPSPLHKATVFQKDARMAVRGGVVTATDPPYYDNIGYADLSDFFYVWLRRSLEHVHPELLSTMVAPKTSELIASPYRHSGSVGAAEAYFEEGFVEVFTRCRQSALDGFPMSLFYAFKQSEELDESGLASTGWATMLEGLATAGWMVTATWPIRTEMGNRMIASGTNALASSVVLACRPRPLSAGATDRQGLIRSLQRELPLPLRELQKAHIAPVDLRQAAIGPGMAVFSRFLRVIEPDGSTMRVRTALGLINQALEAVLDEQEGEFDGETRWAIHWFSQFFTDAGPYGVAEQLAVSMNVSVKGMEGSGILLSGGGKVRLRSRVELRDVWESNTEPRISVWAATQLLVQRLEEDGEAAAGNVLRRLGGLGESARLLAYRLYTACEKPKPALAGPYNTLVASWPEIQRHAQQSTGPMAVNEQRSFNA